MKVGIIGRTDLLLRAAKNLASNGHEIVFVYTCKAEEYYSIKETDFEAFANQQNCKFYNDLDISNNISELKHFNADVCISVNWLNLLTDKVFSIFPYGILNAHAGDLPRYRGNACPNWAILNHEQQIGLTVHQVDSGLDSGPYILKKFLDITEDTYVGEIYQWLEDTIPQAFAEAIDLLGVREFTPQDPNVRTLRVYPRKPEDSRIDWTASSRDVHALVRASSSPFPGAFCFLDATNQMIRIHQSRIHVPEFDFCAMPGQVCFSHKGNPVIATGDGMLELLDCREETTGLDARPIILKSLRNRLVSAPFIQTQG